MTGTPSYQVDPEQLRSHASRLTAHADQLATTGAALPAEMGAQSLGAFAQFITAGLGSAMQRTMDAFGHASSTVDTVSGALRRAADEYQNSDSDHATGLTGIGSRLEEGPQ
ncbi:type VII secretion target [Prauserella cavernicola]|uniref:WXG100 family type VII secretion target n=1 Tax=Prauserella cavernicola TaxID=2800127 RepID=A0A934QMZ3_9PSEU|nr:type VII secretion target [Prauserella cavernicola]MBK1783576.1 WXG100 family type VII secretion target [Prauserella cavernicola]